MIVWTDSCQRNRSQNTVTRAYYQVAFGMGWTGSGGRNNGPKNIGTVQLHYPRNPVPSGNTFIGFVRHVRHTFSDGQTFLSCRLLGGEQVGICYTSTGAIALKRNGTQIAVTGAGLADGTTLHGFAMKAVLHASTGTVVVYMNGIILPDLTFTGNTAPQATATWDSFSVGTGTGGTNSSWCDLMIADGTNPSGSDLNDVVPDVCVDYCGPNGNGYSSQFVGDDGNSTDNYLLVDDTSGPEDSSDVTDAVVSTTPAIDGYALANHPSTGATILGRTVVAVARKTTTGVGALRVGARVSGVNTMGSTVGLLQTYTEVRANLPPVSEANFNASEAVVELL